MFKPKDAHIWTYLLVAGNGHCPHLGVRTSDLRVMSCIWYFVRFTHLTRKKGYLKNSYCLNLKNYRFIYVDWQKRI
jgi:hypothetical protein